MGVYRDRGTAEEREREKERGWESAWEEKFNSGVGTGKERVGDRARGTTLDIVYIYIG